MTINWEAISAFAALLSSIAVLAAVVIGVRQVSVGAKALQLEGTMKIFEMIKTEEQRVGRRFIEHELGARMTDPVFARDAALGSSALSVREHYELPILQLMEMVGTYVKHGLLGEALIFDYISPIVIDTWEKLTSLEIVAMQRKTYDASLWENYEYLYKRCKQWEAARKR